MADKDVQIKFRAPQSLKDRIDAAADKDIKTRTTTAWLIAAALEKLENDRKKNGGK